MIHADYPRPDRTGKMHWSLDCDDNRLRVAMNGTVYRAIFLARLAVTVDRIRVGWPSADHGAFPPFDAFV